MKYIKIISMWLVVLFVSTPSFAQSNTPEELAESFFKALQTEGQGAMTRFMHPKAMVEFKSMLIPVYQAEALSGTREFMGLTFGKDMDIQTLKSLIPKSS